MKSAAKVGLLVLVFAALLIVGFGVLGRSLFGRTVTYYAELPDAGGVSPGTRVLMAGVRVGNVTDVALADPRRARFTLAIDERITLPEGTTVLLPTSLVGLGDSPVTLVPPVRTAGRLAPGSVLPGRKAGPLDNLLPGGGKETFTEVNKTLAAMRRLLEDQGLKKDVQSLVKTTDKTLQTSQATLAQFTALAQRSNQLLARNEANLDAMVGSARRTLQDVNATANELARFAQSGTLQRGTKDLLVRANGIARESESLLKGLNATVNDPALKRDLSALARNAAAASESAPAIAKNAEEISASLKTITARSEVLPDKLGNVLDKAASLEEELKGLIEKVGGFFGRRTGGSPFSSLSTQMDLLRETGRGYWRTDLNATVPTGEGFVTFGLFDAFGSNKLNAQYGRNYGRDFTARYGIFASKPAVGVDLRLSPRLYLRNDLWDINDPRLDSRLRYDFGNGLIGWLGFDRLFDSNSGTIGIGIRR